MTSAFGALVDQVEPRIPQPIDALEVTAVLESIGYTDSVAVRYGAADSFGLGEAVLDELRRRRPDPVLTPHTPPQTAAVQGGLRDILGYLLTAVPALAAIGAAQVIANGTDLSPASSWALWLGILLGVTVSNGLLQGLTPRASLYVGCGNWDFARKLARGFTRTTIPVVIVLTVAIAATATGASWGSSQQRWLFAGGFGAMSLLGLASAGLVVAQRLRTVGVVVGLGAAAVLGLDLVLRLFLDDHALVALAVGYALVVGMLLTGAKRVFDGYCTGPVGRASLPPISRLLPEAAPYGAYGVLVMGLLIIPHVVAALALGERRAGQPDFVVVEVLLNVGLLPLLMSTVLHQRTCMWLWICMRNLQIHIPGDRGQDFSHEIDRFYCGRVLRTLLWLLGAYSLAIEATLVMVLLGGLDRWVGSDRATVVGAAVVAGAAYIALGVTMMIGMVAMTLRQPGLIVNALLQGMAVALVLGLMCWLWLPVAAVALPLLGGALWSARASHREVRRALRRADHLYAAAL